MRVLLRFFGGRRPLHLPFRRQRHTGRQVPHRCFQALYRRCFVTCSLCCMHVACLCEPSYLPGSFNLFHLFIHLVTKYTLLSYKLTIYVRKSRLFVYKSLLKKLKIAKISPTSPLRVLRPST